MLRISLFQSLGRVVEIQCGIIRRRLVAYCIGIEKKKAWHEFWEPYYICKGRAGLRIDHLRLAGTNSVSANTDKTPLCSWTGHVSTASSVIPQYSAQLCVTPL